MRRVYKTGKLSLFVTSCSVFIGLFPLPILAAGPNGDSEAERAVYEAAIKKGVPGGACACPAGYMRLGFNNSRPIFDAKEIGVGDGAWCINESGDTTSAVPCLAPGSAGMPGSGSVLPAMDFKLELVLETTLENEAECKDKMDQAIGATVMLLASAAAQKLTESGAYCKTLFPEPHSPSQKVSMAAYFSVHTFEECLGSVGMAKTLATSVKHWMFNELKAIDDDKEYCLQRYQAFGGKVDAATMAALKNVEVSALSDLHSTTTNSSEAGNIVERLNDATAGTCRDTTGQTVANGELRPACQVPGSGFHSCFVGSVVMPKFRCDEGHWVNSLTGAKAVP